MDAVYSCAGMRECVEGEAKTECTAEECVAVECVEVEAKRVLLRAKCFGVYWSAVVFFDEFSTSSLSAPSNCEWSLPRLQIHIREPPSRATTLTSHPQQPHSTLPPTRKHTQSNPLLALYALAVSSSPFHFLCPFCVLLTHLSLLPLREEVHPHKVGHLTQGLHGDRH